MPDEIVIPTRGVRFVDTGVTPITVAIAETARAQGLSRCKSPNWNRTDFIRPSKKRANVSLVLESASSDALCGSVAQLDRASAF